jgi:predicted nucleotidyltransferase
MISVNQARLSGTTARNTPRVQARLARLLEGLRGCGAERIYLFGSAARGEADDLSDLDVVVILRSALPFFDRLRELARLIPPAAGGVDLLAYTPDEFEAMQRDGNAFAEMVLDEGQLIYGRPQD